MDKKILGIIIICIFFLIIYKKESFLSTGFDKILNKKTSDVKSNENIIETSEDVKSNENIIETTENIKSNEKIIETTENVAPKNLNSVVKLDEAPYGRIVGIFLGVLVFIFIIIRYKWVTSGITWLYNYILGIPTKIMNKFTKNKNSNDSDDIYSELDSIGGKNYYMGGYDFNDYSE